MSEPNRSDAPLAQLRQLAEPAEQAKLQTDSELLALYIEGGDRSALERLIERYAPMVASVCRLTSGNVTSAEDAFQATFLIFLKSAHKIRKKASVAAWLHGVAYRTACRTRSIERKQSPNLSSDEVSKQAESNDPLTELARKMELELLDRELHKLPMKLQGPLVEHYLLGYSAPEIAQRMDLSISAVEGRLRRGRSLLRTQLARRGISLSVALAGSVWFQQHVHATEAAQWTSQFLDQYMPADGVSADLTPSSEISSLVQGEMSMFSVGTAKSLVVAALVIGSGMILAITVDAQDFSDNWFVQRNGVPVNAPTDLQPLASESVAILPQFGNTLVESGNEQQAEALSGTLPQSPNTQSNGPSQAPGVQSPITWERPDASSETPSWLSGGRSSVDSQERNRELLAQSVGLDFVETPLSSVVDELSDAIKIPVDLNLHELDLVGMDPDVPITIHHQGSVRELLRRLLTPLELSYIVNDSTIEITSSEDTYDRTSLRFYDLAYVLPNSANVESLIAAIEASIDPDCWLNAGGQSSISAVGSMLVVTTTEPAHQQIEVLLYNISKMKPANVSQSVPTTASPGGFSGGMGGGGTGMGGGMF